MKQRQGAKAALGGKSAAAAETTPRVTVTQRVDRSPEEKWQIIQEGIKSGNVSETCRRHS